jgi:diguanylate cyclase (GGDEF)-like protein
VAHAAALTTLAGLGLLRSDALPRGLFWATVAILAGTAVPWIGAAATLWPVILALTALLVSAVEEAHRLAYHDGLTGLPSRRALDERLQRLAGRYTVAMVDVDHFKQFNDRHGHDVGDQVLRLVATRLRDTPGARAYRYGGEEFALVFRGRSLEDALEALEGARRAIGERPFVVRGADRPARKPKRRLFLWRDRPTLSVTVSLGAAERRGWRQSPEDVVKSADQALYRAKEKGRNRVVAA